MVCLLYIFFVLICLWKVIKEMLSSSFMGSQVILNSKPFGRKFFKLSTMIDFFFFFYEGRVLHTLEMIYLVWAPSENALFRFQNQLVFSLVHSTILHKLVFLVYTSGLISFFR